MKKIFLTTLLCLTTTFMANAQRFALIDMEYILKNIPAYSSANSQLESSSKKWTEEINKAANEAKDMYEKYQNAKGLTETQKTQRENAIVEKEKKVAELRKKYFGPEGEMAKKQKELIGPIEDKIYDAVKVVAQTNGYAMVLDRASASSIIYASIDNDISDEILDQLGYSK